MRDFLDAIKAHVAGLMDQRGQPRVGVIDGFDGATGLSKVVYHPGDMPSGWLPNVYQALGNGWGLIVGPVSGTQVVTIPQDGDAEHGIIVGAIHSQQMPLPQVPNMPAGSAVQVQPGESMLVHQSGQVIRLCADGTIYTRGTWKHEGSFTATGMVTGTEVLNAAGTKLGDHVHMNGGGTGNSGQPVPGS